MPESQTVAELPTIIQMYDNIVDTYKEMTVDDTKKSFNQQAFQSLVSSLPKEFPNGCILDVGCGVGNVLNYIQNACEIDSSRLFGCDVSTAMIKTCQKDFPSLEFFEGSALDVGEIFNKKFPTKQISGILSLCVFQHLSSERNEPITALQQFHSLLKSTKGSLLLCIWEGEGVKKWGKEDDETAPYGQLFTQETIQNHLKQVGFQVDKISEGEEFGMKLFYVLAHVV